MDGWYVDDRCTNCDVARQLAPDLIDEENGTSRIVRQPGTEEENRRLHAAVFACHTRSIRPTTGQPDQTLDPFPLAPTTGCCCAATTRRAPRPPTPICCAGPTAPR